MKLNEQLVRAQDQLEALEDLGFNHLDFDWEGIKFQAAANTDSNGTSRIHLNASLGRLYFTVENAAHRAMAMERVYATNRQIDGKYAISQKGGISFQSSTQTDSELNGNALICALTTILLEAENHLRALKSHLKSHL
ncbi:MAG: hypothetical protein KUG56_01565 [Kordiimonadaceae bacterium]|nr:hypothetical protein [Kordiimonadaceae bacterium]